MQIVVISVGLMKSEEETCKSKGYDFIFGNIYTHVLCNNFIASDGICISTDLCVFQNECTEQICDQCQDQVDRIITECSVACGKDYVLSVCGVYTEGLIDQGQRTCNNQGRDM